MLLRNFKILLLAIALITLHACKEDKAKEIPVEDFFQSDAKWNFKLSPNGKYLSYLKPEKEKQTLIIESLLDGSKLKTPDLNKYSFRDYSWTFDNQITFFVKKPLDTRRNMYIYDIETSKIKHLLSENKVEMWVLNRNRVNPQILTIVMNKRDTAKFDLYRLNTNTGQLREYYRNPGNIKEWYPDIDGKERMAKASDGADEKILYRPSDNVPFKNIITSNFKDLVKFVAFTNNGNSFYALSNLGRDKTALVQINSDSGKEEKVLFSTDKADIDRVEYSKNTRRIDFVAWDEAKPQKHFLNADAERMYNELLKQLSGSKINIIDRDTAENKFVISAETDRKPESFYLFERKTGKLTPLQDNSTIDPKELCEMKPISYRASDGRVINGYLTLPQGSTTTNLPVVVIPHNGMPLGWSHDAWGYNTDVQFLANRGYAVLQVNYRGSAGFGKEFYSAGFKEIGGKIQQDIADGVNWLINKKIADPKRIAIFGRRGFGGFSALYGVSFYPKLYKCAIVQNGIINVLTYIRDSNNNPFFKASPQKMYEIIGNPETDANKLIAISPAFHPEKIKVPLLIFQRKDPSANISELERFVVQLQTRKVPVTYKTTKTKWQTFTSPSSRGETYTEIEKFLDVNLKGKN